MSSRQVTEHVVVLCTDVVQCGQSLAALPVRQGHREDAFLGPVRVCLGNVTTTYPWLATRAPPSGEMADASRGPMSTGGGHTKLESTIRYLATGYMSISSGPPMGTNGRCGGMKSGSRLQGRTAVVGFEKRSVGY